jgi:predicted DCC family thiol-disulfide oxidoreductase YuxK
MLLSSLAAVVESSDWSALISGLLVATWAAAGISGFSGLWAWVVRGSFEGRTGLWIRMAIVVGIPAVAPVIAVPWPVSISTGALIALALWVLIDGERAGHAPASGSALPVSRSGARDVTVVLYDHACPMCRAEMQRLKRRDTTDRLRLVDIVDKDFRAEAWGFSAQSLADALHARAPDRRWLIGMAAIRHVYAQVGLGWLLAPTGWPLVGRMFDRLYAWIARNRMWVSRAWGANCGGACDARHGA